MLGSSYAFGGYVPGSSPLHRLNPYTKASMLLGVVVTIFVASTAAPIGLVAAACFAAVATSPAGRGGTPGLLRLVSVLAVAAFVLNALFTPGPRLPGPEAAPIWPTVDGLDRGGIAALRLAAMAALGFALVTTTSPRDLGEAVERTVGRIPGLRGAGLAVDVASRFTPGFITDARRVAAVRSVRVNTRDMGVVDKLRDGGSSLLPLMVSAVRRAERLSDAMAARCYEGGRVGMRGLQMGWPDLAALAATVVVCSVALVLEGIR